MKLYQKHVNFNEKLKEYNLNKLYPEKYNEMNNQRLKQQYGSNFDDYINNEILVLTYGN